jgi:quercetin dioxygenase-like cupin family protein
MSEIHAERREPTAPAAPIDLAATGRQLLEDARGMASGRAARTLIPGAHAPLKQTLVALRAGVELSEHDTNGPATIYLLEGRATLPVADAGAIELAAGQWAVVPDVPHGLAAGEDCVALITVAPTAE